MINILHILPHLGGGVGAAYQGLILNRDLNHEILLLEQPQNEAIVARIREHGASVLIQPTKARLHQAMEQADVILLNWWNHPLNSLLLHRFPQIPVRTILWSHVNGCTYPYFRWEFLDRFDRVLFTTPWSFEHPEIALRPDRQHKMSVVYGLGNVDRFQNVTPRPHHGFRIGYLGTIGWSKLHPQFVSFCAAAATVDETILFVLVGDPATGPEILDQAASWGMEDRFRFTGYSQNVAQELAEMDCVGYLLNPFHFGATENVILEAMAAGLNVILLNQNTERYIVQHGKTGWLVETPEQYRQVIEKLYKNPDLRTQIGIQARKWVLSEYQLKRNNSRLTQVVEQTMREKKKTLQFQDLLGPEPADWFLYFTGPWGNAFQKEQTDQLPAVFKEKSKGSPAQFAAYFPEDERLAHWADMMTK